MSTDDVAEPKTAHQLPRTGPEPLVFLVGVDGSQPSFRAVEFAARRAAGTTGRVILAHIVEWTPYSFNTAQENERRHVQRAEELEEATKGLQPLLERVRELGAEVSGSVHHGHPAQTLVELAHKHGATHIVVGRTGQSRVRSLLFGSTPSHLIQVTDVPVTVVP
jgi:nucleotide-binding universal stress UspA family protein